MENIKKLCELLQLRFKAVNQNSCSCCGFGEGVAVTRDGSIVQIRCKLDSIHGKIIRFESDKK